MTWHGWAWHHKRWHRVCSAHTKEEAWKQLDRLHPVKNNLHHALTRGQVPNWDPDLYPWQRG